MVNGNFNVSRAAATPSGEKEQLMNVSILGSLKYGKGAISSQAFERDAQMKLVMARAAELIINGECLVSVEEQDDGCGDGRPADEVTFYDGSLETRPITPQSPVHERAKVFGGGYIISHVMDLALGRRGARLDDDLRRGVEELSDKGIFCGFHTGQHQHGDAVDCGANDREMEILTNALDPDLLAKITDTTRLLADQMNQTFDDAVFERVFGQLATALTNPAYFAASTGRSRFQTITEALEVAQDDRGDYSHPLAVNKNLAGDHHEAFIMLNFGRGTTFSQHKFRDNLAADFPAVPPANLPQVFTTDFARIAEIARAKTDNDADYQTALAAGLIYSVATAATLTDGSLLMFIAGRDQ
jgi:hypothetical protein